MADTKKIFKGVLQHTHDTFKNLSTEDRKGYLILVRDKDGDNSKNTEIWFGNRRYAADAETLINALDATVSGASSHVTVTVSEEDGKLTGITIVDDIDNTISQEINKLDATVSGNSSVDTALTQPLFVKVTEENGVLTGVEVKENIKSKYIDVLDANVSGNSKYVTVNVVETDGKVTSVNVSDTIDDAIANLNNASHTHSNKAELDKVKDGDVSKWDGATDAINLFLGSAVSDQEAVIDTLKEIQDFLTSDEGTVKKLLDDVAANKGAIETLNDNLPIIGGPDIEE